MKVDPDALSRELKLCAEEFNRLADLAAKVGLEVHVDVLSIHQDRGTVWSQISVEVENPRLRRTPR